MSRPQNSLNLVLTPKQPIWSQKSTKRTKNLVKTKDMIEGSKENKSFSALRLDLKTVLKITLSQKKPIRAPESKRQLQN